MINWNISNEDDRKIHQIIARVYQNDGGENVRDYLDAMMDLTAVHCNGCELKLDELLVAKDSDFYHDVNGIGKNLNRKTGKLDNNFLPRFAA